jgi:hypothetical protein
MSQINVGLTGRNRSAVDEQWHCRSNLSWIRVGGVNDNR